MHDVSGGSVNSHQVYLNGTDELDIDGLLIEPLNQRFARVSNQPTLG